MFSAILTVGPDALSWARALERVGGAARVDGCEVDDLLRRRSSVAVMEGVDEPEGFDLIIVHGVCAGLDATANERLVQRLGVMAAPGAAIVIADPPPAATEREGDSAPDGRTAEASPSGAPRWPLTSYARWLAEAGFSGIRSEALGGPGGVLVHAIHTGAMNAEVRRDLVP